MSGMEFTRSTPVLRQSLVLALLLSIANAAVLAQSVPRGGFVVNSGSDEADASPGDGFCNTRFDASNPQCTLRAAIEESNARGVTARINFNLPVASGFTQIQPRTALPPLRVPVVIDGSTQPGTQRVDLDGRNLRNAGVRASALVLRSSGSRVSGLAIHGFTDHAIELRGTGNHIVSNNFLGTFANGTSVDPNAGAGVYIEGSAGNLVGGTTAAARNVFAGSPAIPSSLGFPAPGLYIAPDASNNRVEGNHFGLDRSGAIGLGLGGPGVFIANSRGNIIGGTESSEQRNVIALVPAVPGNTIFGFGILLSGPNCTSNSIVGNRLGTDPTGTLLRANGGGGIRLFNGPSFNSIRQNLILGSPVGVLLGAEAGDPQTLVAGNLVEENLIGTNTAGNTTLGNRQGVLLAAGTSANVINRNVMSGNLLENLVIEGDNASGNLVLGNLIGTDPAGTRALITSGVISVNNLFAGVRLGNGAQRNQIGKPGEGNIISGNPGDGILLRFVPGGASNQPLNDNIIEGNQIGTDHSGRFAVPNSGYGIRILDAAGNGIGGDTSAARNTISGNRLSGILIAGARASGNRITSNHIGTDTGGALSLPNGSDLADACRDGFGIHVVGAAGNRIGAITSAEGERNLIRANRRAGIRIEDFNACLQLPSLAPTSLVDVRSNRIFGNGGLGIDLGVSGPDTNDNADVDSGPNTLLNAPVLQTASPAGTLLAYNGAAGLSVEIDLYANSSCDASGFGEGEQFITTILVNTNNIGQGFANLPRYAISGKNFISAVARAGNAPGNRTSEFSNCVVEGGGPGSPPAFQASSLQTFQFTTGGAQPAAQSLQISAVNASTPLAFSISSNVNWIQVTPSTGQTPASLSVRVNPAGLPIGLNSGTLTISGGAASTTVSVLLNISAGGPSAFLSNPSALSFSATVGSPSTSQTLAISSGFPVNFDASDNAPWLELTPPTGVSPGDIAVQANFTGLSAGTYSATIFISGGGLPVLQVPVTLTLTAAGGGGSGVVQNGSFETGFAPWVFTNEASLIAGDGLAHAGSSYALLAPQALTSTVYQSLTVPCSGSPRLSFQLNVTSTLQSFSAADRLFAEITTPTGAIQQILANASNLNAGNPGAYQLKGPFDLSAYACQNVRVQFRAVPNTSFGGATSFRIDSVNLN